MGKGKIILGIIAVLFYLAGLTMSIGLPFVGIIPGLGDAVAAAGAVLEEALQFIAFVILFALGVSRE